MIVIQGGKHLPCIQHDNICRTERWCCARRASVISNFTKKQRQPSASAHPRPTHILQTHLLMGLGRISAYFRRSSSWTVIVVLAALLVGLSVKIHFIKEEIARISPNVAVHVLGGVFHHNHRTNSSLASGKYQVWIQWNRCL